MLKLVDRGMLMYLLMSTTDLLDTADVRTPELFSAIVAQTQGSDSVIRQAALGVVEKLVDHSRTVHSQMMIIGLSQLS